MRSRHRGRAVAALVATIAVGTPIGGLAAAPAPAERRAALLPVQFEGDFNEGWRDQIEGDLARGLVQAGMEVVDPAAVVQASGGVSDCNNAKCFEFLASSIEAGFLVRARITVAERNYEVDIDIIDGQDGSLAASSHESCQLCGLAEVGDLVTKQAAALRQKIDVLTLEPAVVAITSEPAGATIWIDGEKLGAAPLEHELTPGRHEAEARKRGYLDQTRAIDAVQGVRESITFELLASGDRGPAGSGDWKIPTGWALVGVGAAGLAAGVTFLVIDENPYKSQCSGPDVDALGNCRQRYNTLLHGALSTAAGGAFLVTGAALLIAARVARGRRAGGAAARLRIGPDLRIGLGTIGGRF